MVWLEQLGANQSLVICAVDGRSTDGTDPDGDGDGAAHGVCAKVERWSIIRNRYDDDDDGKVE